MAEPEETRCPENRHYDVLVLGAGMSGLTAARALAESGRRTLVLEAQDRIGGRILTRRVHGEVLELGAEFIHGKPPELWALLHEAGLETRERGGTQICSQDGRLAECSDSEDETFTLLENLDVPPGPDLNFAEYLDYRQVPASQRQQVIGYVEGFNAADHRRISVASLARQQQAEDATEGHRLFHLPGGYDQLPNFLADRIAAAGGSIRRRTPVHAIHWRRGGVELRTPDGAFSAAKAVITLPLSVLQSRSVALVPAPSRILAATEGLRMGPVQRFTLLFRERFWAGLPPQPALDHLSFLFSEGETPSVWWTPHPEVSNSITGWVGGPRATGFAHTTPDALAEHACETLARILSLDATHVHSLLLACETHDWQADPYSRGAYSYVVAGGLNAPAQLAEPVADTLYFAGEHTDLTGNWGTVHAAIRSGLRAAGQILHPGP